METPLDIDTIASTIDAADIKPLAFFHSGPYPGQFRSTTLTAAQAGRVYTKQYRIGTGASLGRQIHAFALQGEIAERRLGGLAEFIESTRILPAGSPFVVVPKGSDGDRINQLVIEESQARRQKEATEDSVAAEDATTWWPTSGELTAQENPSGARVFRNTLQWSSQASLAEFDNFPFRDDAYEHDLKLFRDEPCEEKDFWAHRDGMTLVTTFPEDSGPYLDTEISDDCTTEDFTVGIFRPTSLTAGISYSTGVVTWDQPSVESSPFALVAQKLQNNCPLLFERPECVGLNPLSGEGEILIGLSVGCEVPGFFTWAVGKSPTCMPQGITPGTDLYRRG